FVHAVCLTAARSLRGSTLTRRCWAAVVLARPRSESFVDPWISDATRSLRLPSNGATPRWFGSAGRYDRPRRASCTPCLYPDVHLLLVRWKEVNEPRLRL